MNFKKLLSVSFVLTAALVASVGLAKLHNNTDDSCDSVDREVKFSKLPDLNFRVDTLHLTDENFNKLFPRAAAGQFIPNSNTVTVTYFEYDSVAGPRVKKNCDVANESVRVVMRHEMEHARKARVVQNASYMSPWNRARLAVMNEAMAPAGEIIESQEYRLETGERFPQDRAFLWDADSLIMARHNEIYNGKGKGQPVDFSDPVIADVVLEHAVNKFLHDHNRGFYKTKIKSELKGLRRKTYIPHNQCDADILLFAPDINQWGALWTYDVSTPWYIKRRVDIWNSATAATRRRIVNKVDSVVRSNMEPGQMLMPKTFAKPR